MPPRAYETSLRIAVDKRRLKGEKKTNNKKKTVEILLAYKRLEIYGLWIYLIGSHLPDVPAALTVLILQGVRE